MLWSRSQDLQNLRLSFSLYLAGRPFAKIYQACAQDPHLFLSCVHPGPQKKHWEEALDLNLCGSVLASRSAASPGQSPSERAYSEKLVVGESRFAQFALRCFFLVPIAWNNCSKLVQTIVREDSKCTDLVPALFGYLEPSFGT